ncbi:MAG: hypothetical protein D9V44_05560 [Actinobacteria bacterium]|nr:MAG: hypothetical protein D9V44_05560 [Actinomycetota bacterium]
MGTVGSGLWIVLGGASAVAAGLLIRNSPAKSLLAWDRRTGYSLYKKSLEATGDEARALEAAGAFYRLFGTIFIGIGGVVAAGGLLTIIFG